MSSPNSPAADLREGIGTAVAEIAELNCFAFVEPLTPEAFDERAAGCARWICAEVGFRGPFDGVLRLAVPSALAEALCLSFIGDLDDAGPTERQVFDFTGELTNMAVGAWLSRAHTHSMFDLSHPDVASMPEGWQPRPYAGDAPALLSVDETPVAAWAALSTGRG